MSAQFPRALRLLGARSDGILPSRVAAVLLAALLLSTVPGSAGQQRPTFEATVARVRVDVIVTDDEGRFIDDLRPEDFILYEDDARQEIIRAQLVDLGEGTVSDFLARGSATTGHRETGLPIPPGPTAVPSPPPTSDFGAMVYVIDAYRLGRSERKRFTTGWVSLLEQTEAFNFPRAVYVIDFLGRLRELVPLTNDVERLRRAGQELLGAVYYPDSPVAEDIPSEVVPGRNPEDTPRGIPADEFSFAEMLQKIQDRTSGANTLDILTLVCNSLAGRQGRGALVWVSSGLRLQPNPREVDPILIEGMEQLQQACNSANVSIYGLDPTLVTKRYQRPRSMRITSSVGPVDDILSGRFDQERFHFDSSRDSLFMAARATGGKAYPFKTDVDGTLREIEHDNARFYLLTYAAPPPEGDGKYHEIKVEVRRPGATVRARGGYVDRSEAERRALMGASALALPGSVLDLPVVAGAFQTWTENGEPLLHLAVELVPIREALSHGALDVDHALMERSSLQIHLAAVGEDRQLIDSAHFSMPWGVLADEPQDTAARPPVFLHAWSLGFGRFDLRFLVADEISGRMGTATVKMDVQEPESDSRISEPTLIHARERGPPQPILDGRATSAQGVQVFLEVFGGDEPTVSGRIFNQRRSLVADNLEASFTRWGGPPVHQVLLTVPEDLPAGSYMIEIVVSDPISKDAKILHLPLEIALARQSAH